jgi:hypothetical protein
MLKIEYLISNPSCIAPFSIEVQKETEGAESLHSVELEILGKTFTRIVNTRLDGIIIAKDMARALEDAFRNTVIYVDDV